MDIVQIAIKLLRLRLLQIPATLPYTQTSQVMILVSSMDHRQINGLMALPPAILPMPSMFPMMAAPINATVTSASVVHAYRDITIPSGSTNLPLILIGREW